MPGRSGGVDELRCECLHPPVDRHVIGLDAALAEQLLDVAVRQAVAQVPAHHDRNHRSWEAIAGRRARHRGPRGDDQTSLPPKTDDEPTQQCPRKYELAWLDESIPALGGHPPRECANDPTRRPDLIRLLDSFPPDDGQLGTMSPARLRSALGLS
jgi:hypothetical protein